VTFSWVACKAKTGEVIVDLPYLNVDTVRQSLGRYESVAATLPIDTEHAPDQWRRAVMEGGSWIVLLSETADASGNVISNPIWGGLVTQSLPDESDEVSMTLVTIEGYFDRQYISSAKTYTATDQNLIISDLITSFVGSAVGGIPIRVQVVTGTPGAARDRAYADQDDKTVYSAMQDIMGVQGGAEWYVGWEHLTAPERYTPVLYVGDRIGTAAASGMGASAEFEMPGPVTAFQLTRDFSDGKGANVVMAYSSGQGNVRPQSPPQVFSDADRPKFEYRWTPSTSITDPVTLTGWASSALTAMKDGAISLTMSASVSDSACPQLGTDFSLGDDIGFNVGGLDANANDLVPSAPGGVKGVARMIGYQLTLSETPIITPILSGPQIL
jgi:hypothetical protein